MFFNRNKRRGLAGYRFQNPQFRNRLKSARSYRRSSRRIPQTTSQKFIYAFKLDSKKVQISTIIILLFLIYLAYLPNPFKIREVVITGLMEEQAENAKQTVDQYRQKNKFWAQDSLVFFAKAKLGEYLVKNNSKILKVNSVRKDFPSTLRLDLSPRFEQFFVQDPQEKFLILTNDGLVAKNFAQDTDATSTEFSGLIQIKTSQLPDQNLGELYLEEDKINTLQIIQRELQNASGYEFDYFEITDQISPDVTVYTQAGPKILFDFYSGINETLSNLKLLMSQVGQEDRLRLAYIDMRFESRGFVCFKNAVCAQEAPTATSTPSIDQN